jgi:hypothetical protein
MTSSACSKARIETSRRRGPTVHLGRGGQGASMFAILWIIFVILLVLWIIGFALHVAGSLIHLLLVVALIILIVNLLTGRRR